MRMLVLLLVMSIGAWQGSIAPQHTDARENEQSYHVAGTVVDSATGSPLSRAQVALTSSTTQDAEAMITDDEGRFAFEEVPAGRYVLSAKREGYLEQLYKQHQQFSTAIVTGPGLNTESLRFELRPGASISGVVADEAGEPVRNAQVMLIQRQVFMGRRTTFQNNAGTTNDLGQFRFGHLMPGTYFIAVTATPWYAQHGLRWLMHRAASPGDSGAGETSGVIPPEPELDVVYATTFFPNSPDLDGAGPITLHSGDAETADVRLQPAPAAHLIVHTPISKEGTNIWATLSQQFMDGQGMGVPAVSNQIAPGVLEISGFPMGRMDVEIGVNGNDGRVSSHRQTVQVSGANTEITISEASPPVKVSGVARVEDGAALSQTPQFHLRSLATGGIYQMQTGKDGSLEVKGDGVPPGVYEVWVRSGESVAVKSVKAVNAKVISGRTFEITGVGDVKLDVLLSHGTGTIAGFAMKDGRGLDGVMVALVPEQPDQNLVLFRRDQSDSDGSFTLPGVHPGKYTLIAIESGWEIEWLAPDALKKYLAGGERVDVTPNAKLEMNVKVQP